MTFAVVIPDPPADTERLRDSAEQLRTTAERFEFVIQQVLFAWNLLPDAYRAPEADLVHLSLAATRPAAGEIAEGIEGACRALERFADDIDDLSPLRGSLLRRDAEPPADVWDENADGPAEALNERHREEWSRVLSRDAARLREAYDDASHRCAQALRAIPDVAWGSFAAWSGPGLSDAVDSLSDAAGIALLSRLASAPDPGRLLADHSDWETLIRATDPARVADWWSRLGPEAAVVLVAAVPQLVGNLDGVSIRDRIDANQLRANDHLRDLRRQRDELRTRRAPRRRSTAMEVVERRRELRRLDREIAYFEAVHRGAKLLYAWDPRHGSLIEMSGDPSTARSALFVVPGTNTDADAFMSEKPVTRFADWQVKSSQKGVVAFTIMTGPLPQLDDDFTSSGPQWNSTAADRGSEYARFIQGVRALEPDLWTMSYEHSYGGGIGSEAEKHSGIVDARFLAASVGAAGPYEPHAETAYFATQAPDDINRYYAGIGLGPVGFSVAPESIPGVHIVESGIPGFNPAAVALTVATAGPQYLPEIISQSIEHHTVLMSDDESVNGTVLTSVRNLLDDQGNRS